MSHGITVTAPAMFQSANSSNIRREPTRTVGVTNTVEIQLEDKDTVET